MQTPLILSLLFTAPALLSFAPAMDAKTPDDCSAAVTYTDAAPSIVEIALADPNFSTLVTALTAADLVTALQGPGPFTVFAPTNDAFDKLPEGSLRSLLDPANKETLAGILTYHVASGQLDAASVVGSTGAVSLNGQKIDFSVVVEGEGATATTSVFVDSAKVVVTDIMASNGIIHVIDSVILPASDDLVATAAAAGTFETLLTAARAAGLVETLQGPGPLTVLAPTDAAFAALPEGTVESLLKPENKQQLIDILSLHVIKGRNYASDVVGLERLQPLGKKALDVVVLDGVVTIGGATVTATDLDASNGVIHIIDTVIL
ncbi:MAG: fasciclin domain-containing protein [Planctomycetota bacterium]|nr:fasciclin domain-containing protein [Planctomycetota bacterium]